jgi:uncharacterized membrane protein
MNERRQTFWHRSSVASLAALIMLCVAWEIWLAPLGSSWMALKAVPLLVPLRGVIRRDVYTMQWASMLIFFYFIEGVVRASSVSGIDAGLSSKLALIEIGLSCLFFASTLFYLHPHKRAAKELARQAIREASKPR